MGALREGWQRLRSFFNKPQRDSELDAEVAAHLELAVEENIRHGMPAEEARRLALIRFGGVVQAKEQQREARGLPWLDVLLQDLRFTFRTLGRDRGFTVIAVVILGLGIGANITVFSVVNTILLRPLPLRNPQELVRILTKDPTGGESSMTYSADATEEFQRLNQSFRIGLGLLRLLRTRQPQAHGARSADAGHRSDGGGQFLSHAGRGAVAGKGLHGRGMPAQQPPCGVAEPCVLEAAVRRRSAHCGPGD